MKQPHNLPNLIVIALKVPIDQVEHQRITAVYQYHQNYQQFYRTLRPHQHLLPLTQDHLSQTAKYLSQTPTKYP